MSTITGNQFIEQWYPLQIPSGLTITGKDKSQRLQDGSFNIRIKAKYQAIQILPIESYTHLQEVCLLDVQSLDKIYILFLIIFSTFDVIIYGLLEFLNRISVYEIKMK